MCKEIRRLKMAAKAAEQSGHDKFRHGAVLIRGGSILNIAANSDNHSSFGQRFRTTPGKATHHAELGCILGLERTSTQGSTMYVARVNRSGDWKMSKPCSMCHEVMKYVGVKRVVYTIAEGEWGTYNVQDESVEVGYDE